MSTTLGKTWAEEMKEEGAIRACQENLKVFLEERFTTLPESLIQRIETTMEIDRLKDWVRQAARIGKLEDLQL